MIVINEDTVIVKTSRYKPTVSAAELPQNFDLTDPFWASASKIRIYRISTRRQRIDASAAYGTPNSYALFLYSVIHTANSSAIIQTDNTSGASSHDSK